MLLECKNIRKYFPIKKGFLGKKTGVVKAVDNVDFSVVKGENMSLVGESGSGKSTLARVIMKLYPVTGGAIHFDGENITRANKSQLIKARRNMQMVFQDPYSSLDPRFTIRNILKEGFTLATEQYKTEPEKEKRIGDLLKAVQLTPDMLNRYPHEFSGGERQRIAIARALILNPKLLILDEAVSSLDVLIQEQILELLSELQEIFDLTYLFISHNLRVVKKISQRIAVMYQGKIVELAPTEEIFNNPLHPYTKILLAAALNYKAVERDDKMQLSDHGRLIDRGNGHFVLSQ